MDVGARQPFGQHVGERFRAEPGARAGQRPDLAIQWRVPGDTPDPRRQHGVEDVRTGGRQQKRTLVAVHPAPPEHRPRLRHVTALAAKALLAEIVGHAARGDLRQHLFRCGAVAGHFAQHQHEAIAAQGAALQLACMPRRRQHLHVGMRESRPVRIGLARQLHREHLAGDRVAVLQPRVAHRDRRHASELRQLARHPVGVRAALLHPQQGVFTAAVGVVAKDLLDLKILRHAAQPGGKRRSAVGVGKFLHEENSFLGRHSRASGNPF